MIRSVDLSRVNSLPFALAERATPQQHRRWAGFRGVRLQDVTAYIGDFFLWFENGIFFR